MPNTETRYKNPDDAETIFLILLDDVFGDMRKIESALFLRMALRYSSDSSIDMSGRINPSIPAFFAKYGVPLYKKESSLPAL